MSELIFDSGFKSRRAKKGVGVRVYRNLNNGKFSVMQWDRSEEFNPEQHGKVVGHFNSVVLNSRAYDKKVHVMKGGQKRAKLEGVRNVHLYLFGELELATDAELPHQGTQLTYNPFEHETLIKVNTGEAWESFQTGCKIVLTSGKAFSI